jgi:hypothetical protein
MDGASGEWRGRHLSLNLFMIHVYSMYMLRPICLSGQCVVSENRNFRPVIFPVIHSNLYSHLHLQFAPYKYTRVYYILLIYVTAHMFIRPMCVFRKPELPAGLFSRSGSGGYRKMTESSGIGIGTGYPVKHYRFSENTHWPDKHMGRNICIYLPIGITIKSKN